MGGGGTDGGKEGWYVECSRDAERRVSDDKELWESEQEVLMYATTELLRQKDDKQERNKESEGQK